jgi:DNA-binding transcriptional ArsR family regulator
MAPAIGSKAMNRRLSGHDVQASEGDENVSPELALMMNNARRASDFLKAVAHESRLVILCLLAERERSVTELEELLSLRQTTVSQQLARLRLDRIVVARRDGKAAYYKLADDGVKQFVGIVHDMFCKTK